MTAKSKKVRPPSFKVPLFNNADIVLLRDRDEADQYLSGIGLNFNLSGYDGFAYSHIVNGDLPLLIVGVLKHQHDVLAHELCHVAFEICNLVGVPTPNDGMNETFCYLVQRLMQQMVPFIDDPKKVK